MNRLLKIILSSIVTVTPMLIFFAYRHSAYEESNTIIWIDLAISGFLFVLGRNISKRLMKNLEDK